MNQATNFVHICVQNVPMRVHETNKSRLNFQFCNGQCLVIYMYSVQYGLLTHTQAYKTTLHVFALKAYSRVTCYC